jgi:hypothetical protein
MLSPRTPAGETAPGSRHLGCHLTTNGPTEIANGLPPRCPTADARRVPAAREGEPDGGLSAGDGRQGSIKLARSAARRLLIRSINIALI